MKKVTDRKTQKNNPNVIFIRNKLNDTTDQIFRKLDSFKYDLELLSYRDIIPYQEFDERVTELMEEIDYLLLNSNNAVFSKIEKLS